MRPRQTRRFGRWLVVLGAPVARRLRLDAPRSSRRASTSSATPIRSPGAGTIRSTIRTTTAVGIASWYGEPFHGRATANGELFDRDRPTRRASDPAAAEHRARDQSRQSAASSSCGSTTAARSSTIGSSICRRRPPARSASRSTALTEVRVEFVGLADAEGDAAAADRAAAGPAGRAGRACRGAATVGFAAGPCGRAAPRCAHRQPVCRAATAAAAMASAASLHSGRRLRRARACRAPGQGARRGGGRCRSAPTSPRAIAMRGCGSGRSPIRERSRRRCDRLHRIGFANAFLVKPDAASPVPC